MFHGIFRLVGFMTLFFTAYGSCGTCVNSKFVSYDSTERTFLVETVPLADNKIS